MNRRRFLSCCAAAPLASCATAPVAGPPPRDYARCLPDHLRALAARAWRIRTAALDALGSAEAVRRRRAWVRDTLWRLAGGLPERTPLAVRVTGTLERPAYRVEKLVYESRPGLHVPANLYLPSGREGTPRPGVLFQAGHLTEGKGAAPYQRACQALAKLGYVVLAFDPAGQGERRPPGRAIDVVDDEHDRIGRQLLLAGDSLTRLMLWDAVRSLDVLASRPEVDPQRLASAGQSGGGTLTMLLAAVDDRLAAAAIACANTEDLASPAFDPPGAVDDAEQDLAGAGPLGLDRWDLLYPLAPKPLLVLVSTADPFATYAPAYLTNGRAELARLRSAYAIWGAPDENVRWVETDEPHGLTPARRMEIERWLSPLLGGDPLPASGEPETEPEPEETTWVVPGGDVAGAFGGKTPLDLVRARATERREPPPAPLLISLLGLAPTSVEPSVAVLASTSGPSPTPSHAPACTLDAVEVTSAPSVHLPAWLLRPAAGAAPRSVVLLLPACGRPARAEDEPAWQDFLAQADSALCVADLRATGALAPMLGPGASGYSRAHSPLASFAWASLILGESLLAQQITDVLALVDALSRHPPLTVCPLHLAAEGEPALAALFAAAVDPRIAALHLQGGLASYASLLADDLPCPPAAVLPGVLTVTDLPEVAAAASPRPIILAGPVDGAGLPVPLAAARALYRSAPNVRVAPAPAGRAEALADLLALAASPVPAALHP